MTINPLLFPLSHSISLSLSLSLSLSVSPASLPIENMQVHQVKALNGITKMPLDVHHSFDDGNNINF